MKEAHEDQLVNCALFSDLGAEELKAVANLARSRSFDRGQTVVHADELGDTFCLILSGKVKVAITSADGKEIILSMLGKGEFFGEMAILEGEPRSAAVVAMEPLEIITIHKDDFLALLERNFSVTRGVLAELSRRLRLASSRIESLATMDVYGRLARFFLDLVEKEGIDEESGYIAIQRPTHQAIASTIGTSRETVSRLMHDLIERNVLREEGRTIYLRRAAMDDLSAQG
ncbi:MAG: Crp/Fnr family transcriptional regulator [Acidobacteria bacterium]|nr:Crp/Fnr family transcriptional regulator [Acidobacteriota bacterium]